MLSAQPITKLTAVPDVLRVVFDTLFPHELGNLSLTCKALHAIVFSKDAIREKCVQRALEMSRRALLLPNNGVFRLYTSMCRKFIEFRVVPHVLNMVTENSFRNLQLHFISMRFEGVRYIVRGTGMYRSHIDGENRSVESPNDIFVAGSPALLLGATSVWIKRIEQQHCNQDATTATGTIQVHICINMGGETSRDIDTVLNGSELCDW
jgi:hypothetical protein